MSATGPDDKQYTMSMIDPDTLPMWLASIGTQESGDGILPGTVSLGPIR
ncbi:hypothetical protein J8F10_10265 [Gemmata sp. G18]|uniref:Uncharacterized protein n=1 Tax=Gemmata palustris TaxID=2822762 RepID=A0ABS5BPK5_9BACT|nr:hypothetical protein [Gemmata palustris]MBP3955664.1 hypothetical protein [Gemmata palustris]